MKILVTHPGRQHSHQAAIALMDANMLAGYWSGVPSLEQHRGLVPKGLWEHFVRYGPLPIPERLCRWIPAPVVVRNVSRRLFRGETAHRFEYFACRIFDRQVSKCLHQVSANAVSACEISALNTFQRARVLGWKTILDAPQVHHAMIDRSLRRSESEALHSRVKRLKDAEIELADHIVTVSDLARRSYIEAGISPEKVHCVELGVDINLFRADRGEARSEGPCRFIFAGALSYRKGADILLDAFRKLRSVRGDVELKFTGPAEEAHSFLKDKDISGIELAGPLKQELLAAELSSAHCLVLPSRLDSYGMVVAEALACGTPVIVSDRVGAGMLVLDGKNGWVIPCESADALTERMAWCAENRDELFAMRAAARESALLATWERYAKSYVDLMKSILKNEA